MQWQTTEQMSVQRNVEIGYYPDSSTPFRFTDYNLGDAYGAFAMTGYGKSILVGNIAVELAKHRPLIILDYNGDYRNLKYVNWNNKHGRFASINDLLYIHRFGFKLQDFTHAFDWEMLGMTRNGAELCASRAKQIMYHKNDFRTFRDMVEDVEVFKGGKGEAWAATKQSVLAKLNLVKNAFVSNERSYDITDADMDAISYSGVPFYVSNWQKFISKHRHICLNMNSEFEPAKAQFMAGKILNSIEHVMQELNPVIIIEEAHKLCPEHVDDDNVPYSTIKILHYLKELHKKGVKLILITQYPHQIQNEALDEIKRFFIGKLQNVKGYSKLDDMFRMSSVLNYNYINDYREFWHYSPLYNEKAIFVPYDSFSYYKKRL